MPKSALKIIPELKNLLPALSKEKRDQLEANILADGCRDALVVWKGENILVDGHHRLEICEKHDMDYQIHERPFESLSEARIWAFENQDGRREMEPYMRIEVTLKLKPDYAARAKAKKVEDGKATGRSHKKVLPNSGEPSPIRTDKELAKLAGVGHDTFHKGEKLTQEADEETKEKLRKGETTINKEYKKLKEKKEPRKRRPNNPLRKNMKEEKSDPRFMKALQQMIDVVAFLKREKWTTMKRDLVVHYLEELIELTNV